KRVGVQTITFDLASSNAIDFNTFGLQVLADQAGLRLTAAYEPAALGPHDGFMLRHIPQPGDPPPCQRLHDGNGVYIVLGNPVMPFALYTFICPGHHPLLYKRSGVPQATLAQLRLELSEPSRQMVLAVLVALHGRGVSALQIDRASAHKPFFHPTGV